MIKDYQILKFIRANQPLTKEAIIKIVKILDGKQSEESIKAQIDRLENDNMILCSLGTCVLTRLGLENVYGESLYG